MPVKKGNKLVQLRGDVVKGFARVFESGLRTAPDFTTFVNQLLLDVMKRERFLSQYKPFSHLTHAGSLFIKDNQRKLIAEIIYKDGLVHCNTPNSDSNCEQMRFATSIIELAKYMREK